MGMELLSKNNKIELFEQKLRKRNGLVVKGYIKVGDYTVEQLLPTGLLIKAKAGYNEFIPWNDLRNNTRKLRVNGLFLGFTPYETKTEVNLRLDNELREQNNLSVKPFRKKKPPFTQPIDLDALFNAMWESRIILRGKACVPRSARKDICKRFNISMSTYSKLIAKEGLTKRMVMMQRIGEDIE